MDGVWNPGIPPRARGRIRRALHPADPGGRALTANSESVSVAVEVSRPGELDGSVVRVTGRPQVGRYQLSVLRGRRPSECATAVYLSQFSVVVELREARVATVDHEPPVCRVRLHREQH